MGYLLGLCSYYWFICLYGHVLCMLYVYSLWLGGRVVLDVLGMFCECGYWLIVFNVYVVYRSLIVVYEVWVWVLDVCASNNFCLCLVVLRFVLW